MQVVSDLLSIRAFLHLVVGTILTLLPENFKILTSEYRIAQVFPIIIFKSIKLQHIIHITNTYNTLKNNIFFAKTYLI